MMLHAIAFKALPTGGSVTDQVFADGIGAIAIVGPTVRLDFVTLVPGERDADGQPETAFCQRPVMDIDAFLRASAKVQEAATTIAKMRTASVRPVSNERPLGELSTPSSSPPSVARAMSAPAPQQAAKPPFP